MARNRTEATTRRRLLKTGGGLAVGALFAGCSSGGASSGDGSEPSGSGGSGSGDTRFDGWFENVSNYDGVVDRTGRSEVTVKVGVAGNNGSNAFGPAAVKVDRGTTVVWEWTGKGSSHNVVAEDGSFASEYHGNEGATFEYTFSETGTFEYVCRPHEMMGMRGAVVVA